MPNLIIAPSNELIITNSTLPSPIELNNNQIVYINSEINRGNQIIVTSNGAMLVNPRSTCVTANYWNTNYVPTTSTNSIVYCSSTTTTTVNSLNNSIYYFSNTNYVNGSNVVWTPPKIKRGPLIKKSIRNSIKRAMKLISNFGMEEDVKIFLGGDKVEVSHCDSPFKFIISKYPNSLIRQTQYPGHSTPYKLELYSKTNIHVANLCVIMEDTPLLDQVLALAMFVKSGNEERILHKANYSSLCSDIELRRILASGDSIMEKKLRVFDIKVSDAHYR